MLPILTGLLLMTLVLLAVAVRRLFRQQQDALLKAKVISATGCSVVVTDATAPGHPIVYANPAFRTMTGYADQELRGQSWSLLIGPHTDRASTEKLAMAMQEGRACRVVARHYRKQGTPFWNEITLSPVKNPGGRVLKYVWVMSDITQRQPVEEAHKDLPEPSERLADLLPEAVLVADQSTILYVNRPGVRLLGASNSDQVVGKSLLSFLRPEDFPILSDQTEHQPAQQDPGAAGPLFQINGQSIAVVLTASPILWQGKPSRLLLLSQLSLPDAPVARHSDDLQESRERLDLVARIGHVGLFEHTHATDTLSWSPILRDIYGVGIEEPVSLQRYIELIHPDDREYIVSELRQTHDPAGNGTCEVEHRIVRAGADIRHVRLQAQTLFEGEGAARRPIRTRGTVIDVTGEKKAEASQRDLSQMRMIGTLAGGLAHEFNNTLTAILGFSELALPHIPAESKAHRHIEQVVIAGRKSRELVHQLLTFSQPSDHIKHPLSLHGLVKESLKLLRPTIPSWIELRERIAPTARPISAEPAHMHHMIVHLVAHALHGMRKTGGVLEIGLHDKILPLEPPSPDVPLAAGSYVCLTMRETGEGMEPEMAGRIFDPFPQAPASFDEAPLALSAVHDIVTAHGGTLLVDSGPGLGTTVSVYLPTLPSRIASPLTPGDPLPRGHECILFVDDDAALARFGGEMLESLGYYAVVRLSAAEAWEAFKTAPQRFDLLITDQAMSGMTGEMLTRQCHRLRPDLPVILCAGSDQSLSAQHARACGVAEYVLKPLLLQDLAHTIRRLLDAATVIHHEPAESRSTSTWLIEEHDAISTRR